MNSTTPTPLPEKFLALDDTRRDQSLRLYRLPNGQPVGCYDSAATVINEAFAEALAADRAAHTSLEWGIRVNGRPLSFGTRDEAQSAFRDWCRDEPDSVVVLISRPITVGEWAVA